MPQALADGHARRTFQLAQSHKFLLLHGQRKHEEAAGPVWPGPAPHAPEAVRF